MHWISREHPVRQTRTLFSFTPLNQGVANKPDGEEKMYDTP